MNDPTSKQHFEPVDLHIDDAKVSKLDRVAKARGVSIHEARDQVFNEGLEEALRIARLRALSVVPKSH